MSVVREQLGEAKDSFASVFANRELRRINVALTGSVIGDWAYGVAVAIWAYQEGGATAVGVFGVVRFLSLAVAASIASTLADRYNKKSVMIISDIVRIVLVVVAAALVAWDGPALAIYGLALVTSMVGTAFRPAQASLIPRLANDPAELTSANVVSSTIESVGFFAGPAIGGLLIAVADIWVVYLFNAATFTWSALVLIGLQIPTDDLTSPSSTDESADADADAADGSGGFVEEFTAGFRAIFGNRNLRVVAALLAAQTVVAGASVVFEVAIVFDLLERSESTVGGLNAVLGIGGLLGGVITLALATREKIAGDFGFGVVLWSAPLLLIAAWPTLWGALIAMVLIGVANSVVDINSYTIIQRVTDPAVMGRVFGALETIIILGMALGALIMPLLIGTVGIRTGLAIMGATVACIALLTAPTLRRIDMTVLAPPGVKLLRGVPMLGVLPQSTLERLAQSLASMSLPPDRPIIREGDAGDRYWIVESGTVRVTQNGEFVRELGPGEGFGEIALIRDVPRTATVTSIGEVSLKGLDRDDFLAALGTDTQALELAESVANRFLTLG